MFIRLSEVKAVYDLDRVDVGFYILFNDGTKVWKQCSSFEEAEEKAENLSNAVNNPCSIGLVI